MLKFTEANKIVTSHATVFELHHYDFNIFEACNNLFK